MTFSEYLLRVEGWHRVQKRQLYRDRRTWYNTLVGPHWDPKKLPRSEQAYLPIDEEDKPKMSPNVKDRWNKAVEEYNKKKDARAKD